MSHKELAMPSPFEKLSVLLKELFQLDQANLDSGIYRIMNQRRGEISRFLDTELLCQVARACNWIMDELNLHGGSIARGGGEAKRLGGVDNKNLTRSRGERRGYPLPSSRLRMMNRRARSIRRTS